MGLRMTGIWNPGSTYQFIIRFVWIIQMIPTQVFQYWYIMKHFKINELENLIDSVSTTLPYTMLYLKLFIFWSKRRTFQNLFVAISNDWIYTSDGKVNTDIMTSNAVFAYRCLKFMLTINIIAVFVYGAAFIEFIPPEDQSDARSRKLPLKMELPFTYYDTQTFKCVFLVQFLLMLTVGSAIGFLDAFIITLILHVGGQIEVLNTALSNISIEEGKRGLSRTTIKPLIDRHYRIVQFSENIENLFSLIVLIQLFTSTLVMCCIGFSMIITFNDDKDSKMVLMKIVLFYSAIIMQVFVYCSAGEYLSNKSISITKSTYDSVWYYLNPSDRRFVILLLIRSQKRLKITAGKLMDLSLESFAHIVKTSASYVSVLYAMY